MILTEFNPDRRIFGGFDLSSTTDLTALALVQPHPPGWICNWYAWLPEGRLEKNSKRDGVDYVRWNKQGYLRTTPGERIRHDFVCKEVAEILLEHDAAYCGYDPWNAEFIISFLEYEGITPVKVRQGHADLNEACKRLEAAVGEGCFYHGKNEIAKVHAENVEIDPGPGDTIRPVKPKHGSTKRIDLIAAAVTALAVAIELDDFHESDGSEFADENYELWH